MQAFAENAGLKNLVTLNMTYNNFDIEGLELLRESKRLKALENFKSDFHEDDD